MSTVLPMLITGILALTIAAVAQDSSPTRVPQTSEPDGTLEATPHHADEISRLLQDWNPPGEDSHASSSGDARGFIAHYLSSKPLPELWAHYAAKLGLTPPPAADGSGFQPNLNNQVFPRLGPRVTDGHATLTIKNVQFTADQAERVSTLTRREPGGKSISVHLASQGDYTFVFVTVTPERR